MMSLKTYIEDYFYKEEISTFNKEHGSIEIMGKRKYNYICVRNIDIN